MKRPIFFYLKSILIFSLAFVLTACKSGSGFSMLLSNDTTSDAASGIKLEGLQDKTAGIAYDSTIYTTSPRKLASGTLYSEVPPVKKPAPERRVKKNVYLGKKNIGGMSEIELAKMLKRIASKYDIAVRDASFDKKSWKVKKERTGVRLNVGKIMQSALSARPGTKLKYTYIKTKPKVKAEQLETNVRMIAKYTTPILDRSRSRVKNIRLVSSKLDKKIIMPGEEFSFNKITGRKTRKQGYENATIIVNTPKGPKHKKAPGGGVCQVSTTLYNAVLKCGLKVTERHEHSDDVHYVPDGKDATVTFNGADFRFVNNRKYPIMIRVYIGKRIVQVRIYENSGLSNGLS